VADNDRPPPNLHPSCTWPSAPCLLNTLCRRVDPFNTDVTPVANKSVLTRADGSRTTSAP
jgi:hypothetical protein